MSATEARITELGLQARLREVANAIMDIQSKTYETHYRGYQGLGQCGFDRAQWAELKALVTEADALLMRLPGDVLLDKERPE